MEGYSMLLRTSIAAAALIIGATLATAQTAPPPEWIPDDPVIAPDADPDAPVILDEDSEIDE
jgi:hypothetical protein